MTTFASIKPAALTGGMPYATARVLTSTESDLFNLSANDNIPVLIAVPYATAILAAIELAITGTPDTNSTYIVMQTDLGDGVWFDVAWILSAAVSGSVNALLAGGAFAANAITFTRVAGTAPGSSGSNQIPLGARIRFVGKAALVGGTTPAVTVTIRYRLVPLR